LNDYSSTFIDAVELEYLLGQINPQCCTVHRGSSFSFL
jgi:hypothetical protein